MTPAPFEWHAMTPRLHHCSQGLRVVGAVTRIAVGYRARDGFGRDLGVSATLDAARATVERANGGQR